MQQDWRKRHFGLLFVLALVLALGALPQDVRFDRWLSGERASLVAIDRSAGSLDLALAELRAGQIGYLATGQGPDFWTRRTTERLGQLESTLSELRDRPAVTADARLRWEAATTELARLGALDNKAREQIRNEQPYLAADTVFVEGDQAAERFRTEVAAARVAESQSAEARIARLSNLRLGLNAGVLGVLLIWALFIGRPAKGTAQSEADTIAQMLRELPPPVKQPAATRTPLPAAPAVPAPPVVAVPVASLVNLPEAADLCVDLARVMDSRDIPALLERAATVLGAKGVIIWTLDASGTTLRPTLAHGYSSKVLDRLGVLNVDADNVTSLSFRSMRAQVMPGETPGAAGALAVPIITSGGCSGVLSAEMREAQPAPEMVAVTKILAAQFATLVGPAEAEVRAAQA